MEVAIFIALSLIGLSAFFMLTKKKQNIFWIAYISAFLPFNYIERFFFDVPTIFRYFALVVSGCGALLLLVTSPRDRSPVSIFLIIGVFILVLLSALSAFFNGANIIAFVYGNQGLLMIIFFSIILFYLAPDFTKKDFFRILAWTGIASAVTAAVQRFIFVSALKLGSGDMVTGLFDSDGAFTFFQVFVILIVMTYWMKGEKLIPMSSGLTLLILIASLAIGNNKSNLLFLVLVALFLIYGVGPKMFLKNFGKYALTIVVIAIAGYGFSELYNSFYNVERKGKDSYFEFILDPEYFSNYYFGQNTRSSSLTKNGSLKRGAAVRFADRLISQDPFNYYLGFGPGSTSGVKVVQGKLNRRYPGFKIGKTPLSYYLAEQGYTGLVLNILFIVLILFISMKTSYDLEERVISQGLILLIFTFFVYDNLTYFSVYPLMIAIVSYPAPIVVEEEEYFDTTLALAMEQ